MSDSTTSAGPPSMRLERVRRAGIEKIDLREFDARRSASIVEDVDATTRPCPRRADALGRDLAPAAGRGAEIDHARAGLEQMMLVVDLDQLEGGARAKALALGARHIRIVELALEPELARTASGRLPVLTRTLSCALAASVSSLRCHGAAARRRPRRRPRASSAPACLRAGRGRRRAAARHGNARRIASRMAQPASTRSARSAPMQGLATRSS